MIFFRHKLRVSRVLKEISSCHACLIRFCFPLVKFGEIHRKEVFQSAPHFMTSRKRVLSRVTNIARANNKLEARTKHVNPKIILDSAKCFHSIDARLDGNSPFHAGPAQGIMTCKGLFK